MPIFHRLRWMAVDSAPGTNGGVPRLLGNAMTLLRWAIIALLLSIVAGLFGFTNLSAASAEAAKIFFYIFVALFVLLLILGLTAFRSARGP